MKVVIGLGNPGTEYQNTRHNAGQMLVDQIFNFQFSIFNNSYGWRRKKNIMVAEFPDMVLVKSANIYMNESGRMIHELRYMNYDFNELYLAHDDLDIQLGEYKIQLGVGPKVHGGVNSVEQRMGTKEFWRIRLGIDNRRQNANQPQMESGEEYVLQRFGKDERLVLDEVINQVAKEMAIDIK